MFVALWLTQTAHSIHSLAVGRNVDGNHREPKEGSRDHDAHPVDPGVSTGKGKDEESDRKDDGADHHRIETGLWVSTIDCGSVVGFLL